MKYLMFILTWTCLAVLYSGCGDPRTKADLRSPEQIQAITDTFVLGTTTIGDTYNALGLWNSQGKSGLDEYVVYWTNDGGQTQVNFKFTCDATSPNCVVNGAFVPGPGVSAHDLYSGSVHTHN